MAGGHDSGGMHYRLSKGKVRKVKNRKGWQASLYCKDDDGRTRRALTKMFDCDLKSEAMRQADEWCFEQNLQYSRTGHVIDGKELVADYVDKMVDGMERGGTVQRSTIKGYRSSAKYVRERFGRTRLSSLTKDDVRDWEQGLRRRGLSNSTVKKAHVLLKQALSDAVNRGVIPKNPMAGIKPPNPAVKKNEGINALSTKDAPMVYEFCCEHLSRLTMSAILAMRDGLRRGEVCALRWKDVDFDGNTLRVEHAIGEGNGGTYMKRAKTNESRSIVMGGEREVLRRWLDMQREAFAAHDAAVGADSFVVGDPSGYFHPHNLTEGWTELAKAMHFVGTENRRVGFHDLRHTYATVAIANHVDIKTVSSVLGHSRASMTLDVYASADPDAKRMAAEKLDKVYGGR